jgi:hypothetical protein
VNVDHVGPAPQLHHRAHDHFRELHQLAPLGSFDHGRELRHFDLGRKRRDQRVLDGGNATSHLQMRAEHQHAQSCRVGRRDRVALVVRRGSHLGV